MTQVGIQVNLDMEEAKIEESEALKCLWPLFLFYRVIGCTPILKSGSRVQFKLLNLSWIPMIFESGVSIYYLRKFIIFLFTAYGTGRIPAILRDFSYLALVFSIIVFMGYGASNLPQLFESTSRFERNYLTKYMEEKDRGRLQKQVYFTYFLFILILSIDYGFYLIYFWIDTGSSSLKEYILLYNKHIKPGERTLYWGIIVLCNEIIIYLIIFFPDIFMSISSLIFTNYIVRFNRTLKRFGSGGRGISIKQLEEIRKDYRELIRLIQEYNEYFSPLFVITYLLNSAYLFLKLYIGISDNFAPGKHWIIKLAVTFRIFIVFGKIFFPTWLSARINDKTKETLSQIYDLPTDEGDETPNPLRLLVIDHFTKQLTLEEIGISISGFVTITKSFLLALFSGIATYEIVILQFSS